MGKLIEVRNAVMVATAFWSATVYSWHVFNIPLPNIVIHRHAGIFEKQRQLLPMVEQV